MRKYPSYPWMDTRGTVDVGSKHSEFLLLATVDRLSWFIFEKVSTRCPSPSLSDKKEGGKFGWVQKVQTLQVFDKRNDVFQAQKKTMCSPLSGERQLHTGASKSAVLNGHVDAPARQPSFQREPRALKNEEPKGFRMK